jgi:multidrug efflux pump subunit AcrB
MPDIDIPEITVRINYPDHSAREIENNIIRPLQNNLLQVAHLENIESETKDENAIIKLRFKYGTKIHYAFIETNEKIDAAQNYLPKDLPRPVVVKASATDIPVLNLVISPNQTNHQSFLQLSSFARQVIKKRIEQLPEVAIADISGTALPEIVVEPDIKLLQKTGITPETIANALKNSNIKTGDFLIQNGIYQYRFKFDNSLNTIDDIKNLHLLHQGKLYRIGQICKVYHQAKKPVGSILHNGKKAIVFSVIKQKGAKISDLKQKLSQLIQHLKTDYPQINFSVSNDQSKLLQISLSNLVSSLIIGTILAILILFFFVRNYKIPLIIAISIPSSLLISILLLYLLNISINIISLSGLVLGVGLMIDNAIIVIDNITQKAENHTIFQAVTKGTVEVVSPLISSALTTISVFIPLIFLSGIAGALFYDQAISVSVGLLTSILVSTILIPVIFFLLARQNTFLLQKKNITDAYYDKGYQYFHLRKKVVFAIAGAGILLLGLVAIIPQQKLPGLTQTDTILNIEWKQAVNLSENQRRIDSLLHQIPEAITYIAYSGKQDFILKKQKQQSQNQSRLYINTSSNDNLKRLKKKITKALQHKAFFEFQPADNVFNYIFGNNKALTKSKLYPKNRTELPPVDSLTAFKNKYKLEGLQIATQPVLKIKILQDKLLLYNVSYNTLIHQLEAVFHQNFIDQLKNEKEFIPIQLSYPATDVFQNLQNLIINNSKGGKIPVNQLIKIRKVNQYNLIFSDKKGEYIPLLENSDSIQQINRLIQNTGYYLESGESFTKTFGNELWISIFISIILLYLIMAAQFESFWQPFIILLEIPIDIGFALLFLWIFGSSINIMSLIGIVVMSGIVVNDSILKIHTINLLKSNNLNIDEAIHQAGKLRLKPILMTSLTTILALLPFLFMNGLGAELQKPLALVVIGGLLFGTFISLFFVPLAYRSFYLLIQKKQ